MAGPLDPAIPSPLPWGRNLGDWDARNKFFLVVPGLIDVFVQPVHPALQPVTFLVIQIGVSAPLADLIKFPLQTLLIFGGNLPGVG